MKKIHAIILIALCLMILGLHGCKKGNSVNEAEYQENMAIRDKAIRQCFVNKGVPILDSNYTRVLSCDISMHKERY